MTQAIEEADMKRSKIERLEKAGFKVGTVQEFLGLSDQEMALIELKVHLIEMLTTMRGTKRVTQKDLAKIIGSSQSRVAKIEAADANISLDLICRALFAMGVSQRELGKMIASKRAA
jgi:DNA-binding XRE family transcriptional regulator